MAPFNLAHPVGPTISCKHCFRPKSKYLLGLKYASPQLQTQQYWR